MKIAVVSTFALVALVASAKPVTKDSCPSSLKIDLLEEQGEDGTPSKGGATTSAKASASSAVKTSTSSGLAASATTSAKSGKSTNSNHARGVIKPPKQRFHGPDQVFGPISSSNTPLSTSKSVPAKATNTPRNANVNGEDLMEDFWGTPDKRDPKSAGKGKSSGKGKASPTTTKNHAKSTSQAKAKTTHSTTHANPHNDTTVNRTKNHVPDLLRGDSGRFFHGPGRRSENSTGGSVPPFPIGNSTNGTGTQIFTGTLGLSPVSITASIVNNEGAVEATSLPPMKDTSPPYPRLNDTKPLFNVLTPTQAATPDSALNVLAAAQASTSPSIPEGVSEDSAAETTNLDATKYENEGDSTETGDVTVMATSALPTAVSQPSNPTDGSTEDQDSGFEKRFFKLGGKPTTPPQKKKNCPVNTIFNKVTNKCEKDPYYRKCPAGKVYKQKKQTCCEDKWLGKCDPRILATTKAKSPSRTGKNSATTAVAAVKSGCPSSPANFQADWNDNLDSVPAAQPENVVGEDHDPSLDNETNNGVDEADESHDADSGYGSDSEHESTTGHEESERRDLADRQIDWNPETLLPHLPLTTLMPPAIDHGDSQRRALADRQIDWNPNTLFPLPPLPTFMPPAANDHGGSQRRSVEGRQIDFDDRTVYPFPTLPAMSTPTTFATQTKRAATFVNRMPWTPPTDTPDVEKRADMGSAGAPWGDVLKWAKGLVNSMEQSGLGNIDEHNKEVENDIDGYPQE